MFCPVAPVRVALQGGPRKAGAKVAAVSPGDQARTLEPSQGAGPYYTPMLSDSERTHWRDPAWIA